MSDLKTLIKKAPHIYKKMLAVKDSKAEIEIFEWIENSKGVKTYEPVKHDTQAEIDRYKGLDTKTLTSRGVDLLQQPRNRNGIVYNDVSMYKGKSFAEIGLEIENDQKALKALQALDKLEQKQKLDSIENDLLKEKANKELKEQVDNANKQIAIEKALKEKELK